ncbi:MAG: P-loop NTPase [Thermoguttaceae bacterium]|jgi:capsular exopolysaccharide synthesis family protein
MSMADDRLSLPDETDSQSGALLPVNALPHGNGEWGGLSAKEPAAGPAASDLSTYFHAMRRHWLLALGIGVLCAAIAGPAVFFAIGTRYTAYSVIRLQMQENPIFQKDMPLMDRDRFDIYKNSQQEMLLAKTVLMSALRKPEVKDIPIVQYKTQYSDVVEWLAGKLSVSFPGKAELMMVSISLEDPKQAQALVKAVVDSYMNDVVLNEQERKQRRYDELDRMCGEKEQEMRNKREELKNLVTSVSGSESPESLSTKQRLVLEELQLYRSELVKSLGEIGKARGELAAQNALFKNVDTAEVPEMEIDMLVQTDPVAKQLFAELGWKQIDKTYNEGAVKKGAHNPYAERYAEEVERLDNQYKQRVDALRQKAKDRKKSYIQAEILRLEAWLQPMEKQKDELTAKLKQREDEAKTIGQTSVDIQMIQAQLRNKEQVLANFINEHDKLGAEIKSPQRIFVTEQAGEPLMPSNTLMRIALTILTVLASFCLPVAAIAFWDTRTHRINTAADVSHGLRLPVIGSMPLVPSRVIRQLGSPSPRHRAWHLRLTESVDGIAARLLRKADIEQSRVIMVSSATGGEGKTTLATQLALSLARTGRRTVLVDFDLRRPSFDEMFGVPLSPGVSEVLRHEADAAGLVHPVAADNLAVVTAGRWDRQALASLSNGCVDSLFKQLREDFDFVVVDTSPILPVADARFVSQYVDAVVLSVFRDVSEAPKIQAACDILAAFGAQSVEAVVTGPTNGLYGRHTEYESLVSA